MPRRSPPPGVLHPEITLPHIEEWELSHNSFSLCSTPEDAGAAR